MSGNIFDELREAAKRKAQELEEKYELRSKVEEGLNAATEAARDQFAKIDDKFGVTDGLKGAAARSGVDDATRRAEAVAREMMGAARQYYQQAERAYDAGSQVAAAAGALSGLGEVLKRGREWVAQNPGKAAIVTISFAAGLRAGSALPGLGVTLLGTGLGDHWLFHSAFPVVGLSQLSVRYEEYLRSQELKLAAGQIAEAEREQLLFQRNLAKYVGAPLLGAFSFAAGASLLGAAFTGATAVGLPLTLLLGGNPLLNGVWFFANGLVCINEGYKYFVIAFADVSEVERIVREVQGLLPA